MPIETSKITTPLIEAINASISGTATITNLTVTGEVTGIETGGDTSQIEADIDQLQEDLDTLETTVGTIGTDLDTAESTLSSLSGTVSGHTSSISTLDAHRTSTSNPHSTTASQVGAPTTAQFENQNWKKFCRAATTTTIAPFPGAGEITVDGVALVTGDRCLVKNQFSASANGIYVVGSTWTRASDADSAADFPVNTRVSISEGSTLANTVWYTNSKPSTIGTDNITWSQDSSITHVSNTSNPHSTTAAQTGALVSINDISNAGLGIDLIGANGIEIDPDEEAKEITISTNAATGTTADTIALRDGDGKLQAATGTAGNDLITFDQMSGAFTFYAAIVSAHTDNTSNPHSVTATQVGCPTSIDGVSNAGGDIDLVEGTGIDITPNDGSNTITIAVNQSDINAMVNRSVQWTVFIPTTNVATGDGKLSFHVSPMYNGKTITYAHALLSTAGSGSGTHDIQIRRVRGGTPVDVFSTKLTVDVGETGSDTAASAVVINTSNDDLQTNDILFVDVDAVSSTPGKGLLISLELS